MSSGTKGKFWNNVQPKAKKALKGYRVLSLFSGAGGLDIGFEVIGFNVVGCVEIDRDSCRTLEANRGSYVGKKTKIFHADITKLSPKEVHKEIGEVDK